jgi:hypothetical protein
MTMKNGHGPGFPCRTVETIGLPASMDEDAEHLEAIIKSGDDGTQESVIDAIVQWLVQRRPGNSDAWVRKWTQCFYIAYREGDKDMLRWGVAFALANKNWSTAI